MITVQRIAEAVAVSLEERWGEDRGIFPYWSTHEPGQAHWEFARQVHPFTWGMGLEVQADPLPGSWLGAERWVCISVTLGPFSLWLRRIWPVRSRSAD